MPLSFYDGKGECCNGLLKLDQHQYDTQNKHFLLVSSGKASSRAIQKVLDVILEENYGSIDKAMVRGRDTEIIQRMIKGQENMERRI